MIVFVLAYAAAIPFMNTSLIEGPVARAWHGADMAYFVNFLVAALLYGGYRLLWGRSTASVIDRVCGVRRGAYEVVDEVDDVAGPLNVREVTDVFEYLQPAPWPRFVHGVAVFDRDDPVLVAPDHQGGQFTGHMQPVQCADGLPAVVDHRSQRP